MAEAAPRLVLNALAHAAAHPAGLPLVARAGTGLFAATAAGRLAARQCRDGDLLRILRRERRGKAILEVCTLTARGLNYLLDHDPHHAAVTESLTAWNNGGALGDCPLPELFRTLHNDVAGLTIGQFHDCLRLLHQGGRIHLHPWTGPLYEMPEPAYALLVGHEIAYYASLRDPPLVKKVSGPVSPVLSETGPDTFFASGHEDLP